VICLSLLRGADTLNRLRSRAWAVAVCSLAAFATLLEMLHGLVIGRAILVNLRDRPCGTHRLGGEDLPAAPGGDRPAAGATNALPAGRTIPPANHQAPEGRKRWAARRR